MKKDPMDVDNQDEIAQKLTEASASIAQTIVKELNNGVPIRSLFTPGSASLKELTSRIARVAVSETGYVNGRISFSLLATCGRNDVVHAQVLHHLAVVIEGVSYCYYAEP
jgi:hypothetical protein